MKTARLILFGILLLLPLYFAFFNSTADEGLGYRADLLSAEMYSAPDITQDYMLQPRKGPELERFYFELLHRPYGAMLEPELMESMWSAISEMPEESPLDGVEPWEQLGPPGMEIKGYDGSYYSGRILDIDYAHERLLIAAASGGLWLIPDSPPDAEPVFLTAPLTTVAISTVASNPVNENVILVGSGEQWQRSGNGVWRTDNGGATWRRLDIPFSPSACYRIRFDPVDTSIVHLTTEKGYYRSLNGGATFTRVVNMNASDLGIAKDSTNIMFIGAWGSGVYKSTDRGASWNKILTGGIPVTGVGRTSLAVHNSQIVYAAVAKSSDHSLLGVFKTTDGGVTWSNVSPDNNYLGGQGWYDNMIGVSPVDANKVIVGGVTAFRTSDSGDTWTMIDTPDLHVDHHALLWSADGGTVWAGNDGGLSISTNNGVLWSSSKNRMPITQYVNIGVGESEPNVYFGGSQDNGMSGTTDDGATWYHTTGGDGGSVTIDPHNAARIWATLGVYGGDWAFRRLRSTNYGWTWNANMNGGIDPSGQWYHKIRNDKRDPVFIYNNSGQYIYRSTNNGTTWTKMNPLGFGYEVNNFSVSHYNELTEELVIYACISNGTTRLQVYDDGMWQERSTGLPASAWVQNVRFKPGSLDIAYAVMNGLGSSQKVFKTTDRGVTWSDITGNLPNVPMTDIVAHPLNDSILFLGSEMGCYRTLDGGASWHRWNKGMPNAVLVTEMAYVNSLLLDGTFYIIIGTYGNGMWRREATSDDTATDVGGETTATGYALEQNFPNPFNPETKISFSIPRAMQVTVTVYSSLGEQVTVAVDGFFEAGKHTAAFNGAGLPSGIYYYKISTPAFQSVRKMVLLK